MANEWDVSNPPNTELVSDLPAEHRQIKTDTKAVMEKEHATLGDGNSGGEHKQGSAVMWHLATASIPALHPDSTALTSSDNGRLWHDITTDIIYVLDDYNDPTVDGGWVAIGHYLGDIAINTDKFTVARATGNTVIAGTLGVTGVATVAKGSLLASSDAPTTDAMIANKKYIDDNEAATKYSINPMTGADDSDGTITFPNGLIWKWGKLARTGTDTTLTFAAAFPNACFQVIASGGKDASAGNDVQVHTIAKATAVFRIGTDSDPARWFAIGR